MDRLPVHLRITGLTVTDADVDSRRKAVTKLASTWSRLSNSSAIVAKAAEISDALGGDGTPSPSLATEVEEAVQKHASAFLSSDRPLEVGICAGVAAISMLSAEPGTDGWTITDIYSNALWLALAFQPTLQDEKREVLRSEVLDQARERSLKSANLARERVAVADPPELTVTTDENGNVTTDFSEVMQDTIEALRRNAALDREELDFLWWAQLGRSRVLGRRLAEIAEPTRMVVMGIEGASLLRRLPADVHREIVLRTVDADPELDLGELIEAIGAERETLAAHTPRSAVQAALAVYPLLGALASGTATGAGASVKRKASTWAQRALLEAAMARITAQGPGKL